MSTGRAASVLIVVLCAALYALTPARRAATPGRQTPDTARTGDAAPAGPSPNARSPAGGIVPVAGPADEPPGEWRRAAKDYANTRFSPLAQITADNVARLQVAWTFATGVLRGHEAAPLVAGGTMYLATPYPNILYALDLTQPGARLKWTYEPKPVAAAQGVACCDVVNRGGEFGARGWLAGLDLASGAVAWRAYSTGPDRDVLIGPRFRPFYRDHRGRDLGVATWPPGAWKTGGGNAWGFVSYDPALDLVYYGTANPSPWNPNQRPGDNKWTSTLFARDPDTGEAVWAYQVRPHDRHDYDAINESILLDLPWRGRQRRVLVHPDRNGYVYVIDRTSGEVLSATPFVHVNSTTGVDLEAGRVTRGRSTPTSA